MPLYSAVVLGPLSSQLWKGLERPLVIKLFSHQRVLHVIKWIGYPGQYFWIIWILIKNTLVHKQADVCNGRSQAAASLEESCCWFCVGNTRICWYRDMLKFAGRILSAFFHQLNVAPFLQNWQSEEKDKIVPLCWSAWGSLMSPLAKKSQGYSLLLALGWGLSSTGDTFQTPVYRNIQVGAEPKQSGSREKASLRRKIPTCFIWGERFIWWALLDGGQKLKSR